MCDSSIKLKDLIEVPEKENIIECLQSIPTIKTVNNSSNINISNEEFEKTIQWRNIIIAKHV